MECSVQKKLQATILRKLHRHGYWGGRHTSIDELPKGIPKDLRGDAKDVAAELVKENILLSKTTSYGTRVSLNPKRREDIERIIKEGLEE